MRCLIYGRQIIAVIDLSIAMAIGVGAASAQTPKVPTPALPLSDSSVGQIMSVARRRGDVPGSVVSNILRQRYKQYPAAKREALADSVVEFAIHSARSADQAVIALAIAGRADPGIGGVPYQAAQQQLIRISREAVDSGTRTIALMQMLSVAQPTHVLPYLGEVAASTRSLDALAAVELLQAVAAGRSPVPLADDRVRAAPEAIRILRQLYESDGVRSVLVMNELCKLAKPQKWPKSRRCGPGV